MDRNFFKKPRTFDGGMGQELLSRGLISKGTLWSSSALLDEKNHNLVLDTHLSFINNGAEIILTNTFTTRKVRFEQNKVSNFFEFANRKACELALKAKELSKKDILIAGSIPAQNDTYNPDKRDEKLIESNFFDQIKIINSYVDFFYLDVISSGKELKIALNILNQFNKFILVGLHIKKDGKLPSGESITEVVKKNINNKWIGLVVACVSPEIVEKSHDEIKKLNIPFGFKVNLWGLEEPLKVQDFNKAKFDEVGINPNIILGTRKDITDEIFKKFIKKMIQNGSTILGGCCETKPKHIKIISELVNKVY